MPDQNRPTPRNIRDLWRVVKDQLRDPTGRRAPASSQQGLAQLTPEQLAEVQQFFRRPKFFIFGYPRSGKTLLARLMRIHPEVHCNWHGRFFHERRDLVQHLDLPALQTWLERKSNHWTHGQSLTSSLVRVLCDFVMERDAEMVGKPIVGDETPNHNNGEAVQRLHRIYPEARLLWVVRDGRDAVLFRRIQQYIDKPQLLSASERTVRDEFRKDKTAFIAAQKSIFTESWLEKFARAWAANVRETDAAARELFGERYLGLRYEDLLSDPVGVMTRAWEFLGVSQVPPELAGKIIAQVADNADANWHAQKDPELVRDLDSAEIGAWQRIFTPADRVLFEGLAGTELQAWDYPLSGS